MLNIDKELYIKKNLSFFDNLSKKEVNNIFSSSSIKKYNKGALIHSKDKACTGVILLASGQLRSFMSSHSGKEITLFKLFEFDTCVLSSSCVYKNLTYDISLEAEQDSYLIVIDSNFFKELSTKNIHVQQFLLDFTQDKLSEIMFVLEQVVFLSLENRLANFLVNQYNLNHSTNINLTHSYIANDLGSSREVISRLLKRFENDNLVQISRGSIKIVDIKRLKLLC